MGVFHNREYGMFTCFIEENGNVIYTEYIRVLKRLGIPMSTAINMYLHQISLTGGIPFAVSLPKTSDSLNMDLMTTQQIHAKLQESFDDLQVGKVQDAEQAFTKSGESRHA